MFEKWFSRRKIVGIVLLLIALLTVVSLTDVTLGGPETIGGRGFTVTVEQYGFDTAKIERLITIPLEDEIASIPGITRLRSVSEYGKSKITVIISPRVAYRSFYLALRDSVENVYAGFPRSVQKPRVYSSSSDSSPVYIVSFHSASVSVKSLRSFIERNIKPSYEKIDGTGEIEISGGNISEIHVTVDTKKTGAHGASLPHIASQLSDADMHVPLGEISVSSKNVPLFFKGKTETIQELEKVLIRLPSGKSIRVKEFGTVTRAYRENDTLSRVDGQERVVLAVESNGNANPVSLSKSCNEVTDFWKKSGIGCNVIYDAGEHTLEAIKQLLFAIMAAIISVTVFLAVSSRFFYSRFSNSGRRIIVITASLPITLCITAAVLTQFGTSLGGAVLAGFVVGTGLIIDNGIITCDYILSGVTPATGTNTAAWSKSAAGRNVVDGRKYEAEQLKRLASVLIGSSLTTIIALTPLFFLSKSIPGLKGVSLALVLLITIGTTFSFFFVPPFLKTNRKTRGRVYGGTTDLQYKPTRHATKPSPIKAKGIRAFYRILTKVLRVPVLSLLVPVLACIVGVPAIITIGTDFSSEPAENVVRAHLEFESGASLQSVDKRTNDLASFVSSLQGVKTVETTARRGSAGMSICFIPELITRAEIRKRCIEYGRNIPGCFVHIPQKDTARNTVRPIEMIVSGPDITVIKQIAEKCALQLERHDSIEQVVLHYKNDPPAYVFSIDHKKAVLAGLSASVIAEKLRWALHGPVALKRRAEGKEIDLRVMSSEKFTVTRDTLPFFSITSPSDKTISLSRLGSFHTAALPSKIYRDGRQRSVYFTVYSSARNIETSVKTIRTALTMVELPKGYSLSMDKRIRKTISLMNTLGLLFLLVILLVYMVLACQFESFVFPLSVIAVIPASLVFPLVVIWLAGTPFTAEHIVGFIVITGIVVNNAIVIIDDFLSRIRSGPPNQAASFRPCRAKTSGPKTLSLGTPLGIPLGNRYLPNAMEIVLSLRKRLRPLLLSSGTTILGALPLLIVSLINSGSGGMTAILASVMISGVGGSLFATFFVVPNICLVLNAVRCKMKKKFGHE